MFAMDEWQEEKNRLISKPIILAFGANDTMASQFVGSSKS